MKADGIRKTKQIVNREALLMAAKVLFEAHGYEDVTMREIAKAAGLSTGSLFNNWSGKAALYREVYGHDPVTPEQGRKLITAIRGLGVDPTLVLAA